MKLPISLGLGSALICTSRVLGRYVPTIMRLMVQYLNILNIVLKLGRTANNSELIHCLLHLARTKLG